MKDLFIKDTQGRMDYQSPRIETTGIRPEAAVLSTSNEHWGEEALWV